MIICNLTRLPDNVPCLRCLRLMAFISRHSFSLQRFDRFLYSSKGRFTTRVALLSFMGGIGLWKGLKVSLLSGWLCKIRYKTNDLQDVEENQELLKIIHEIEQDLTDGKLTVGKWKLKFTERVEDLKKPLAQSLFLSENAKRFAIHSQLFIASKLWPHFFDVGSFSIFGLTGLVACLSANYSRLNAFRKGNRLGRLAIYGVIWTVCALGYSELKFHLTPRYFYNVDKILATKDINYLKGALELYEHKLTRNKLLMQILPEKERESIFLENGDLKRDRVSANAQLIQLKVLCRERIEIE